MTRRPTYEIGQRQFERAVANRRQYNVLPLGTALAELFAGPAAEPSKEALVQEAWREAVPESVRHSTRVETFTGGVLCVKVDDPVTRFSLLGQRRKLQQRLRRTLPHLRAIRIVLDENGSGKQ
jgi:hypothetical protein